jgi:hypothetical protein
MGIISQLGLEMPLVLVFVLTCLVGSGFLFDYVQRRFHKRASVLSLLILVVGLSLMVVMVFAFSQFAHWIQYGPSLSWLPE